MWQSEMGIQFWCILYDMKLFASSIQVLLWYDYGYELILYFYELCFLWFILCVVKCNPLHDSCNEIQLSFKPLVTESDPFHKSVLVFSLLLNFVLYFMSYRSLMVIWFSYIFDYIPIQYWFWFYWIIFKKYFSELEP